MNQFEEQTPEDIRGVEEKLDRLAEVERGLAGPGLEDRLFVLTRTGAVGEAGSGSGETEAPTRSLRFPSPGLWKLAAVIAVGAGLGLLAIAWPGGSASPADGEQSAAAIEAELELTLDSMLAAAGLDEDATPDDELEALEAELATLEREEEEWLELLDEALETEETM